MAVCRVSSCCLETTAKMKKVAVGAVAARDRLDLQGFVPQWLLWTLNRRPKPMRRRNLVTDYYEPLLHESGRSGGSGGGGGGGGGSVTVSGPPSRSNSRYPHDVDVVSSGYERPSSHFFERRGDRGDPDGSFLRRQGPLHYRDRPYRNGPFPQSMNERGPVGAGHAHFRSSSGPSPAWNSYESPGPPSSRYPPPDYMEERPERPDFGPSLNQNNVSNSSSKRTGPLPSVTMTTTATTTPLSARKRKSR